MACERGCGLHCFLSLTAPVDVATVHIPQVLCGDVGDRKRGEIHKESCVYIHRVGSERVCVAETKHGLWRYGPVQWSAVTGF